MLLLYIFPCNHLSNYPIGKQHLKNTCLHLLFINQSITEDSVALMNPEPKEGYFCVQVFFVTAQKTLKYLKTKGDNQN